MSEFGSGNVRREVNGVVWFEPVEPLGGIGHLVMTTRIGGHSRTPYDSMNLALHVDDVSERVRMNRKNLLRALARRLREPVVGEQVHGTHTELVGELHSGARWEQNEAALAGTDALVTATRRLPLVTLVADCVPVALVDPVRQAGAVVHAGWRGLSGGVVESALEAMKETWGTAPSDVVAWIGPAIGACCYEVGPDVAEQFRQDITASEGDRSRLDLRAAARRYLGMAGLRNENLTGLELCTACNPELFFSHRRATQQGLPTTGRQALILWLEPNFTQA